MNLIVQIAEELLQLSCALCIPYIILPCQHRHHQPSQEHFDQSIIRLLHHYHHCTASVVPKLSCTTKLPDPTTTIRAFK